MYGASTDKPSMIAVYVEDLLFDSIPRMVLSSHAIAQRIPSITAQSTHMTFAGLEIERTADVIIAPALLIPIPAPFAFYHLL